MQSILKGLVDRPNTFINLKPALLIEQSLNRGEGKLASNGALTAETGKRTGRSPKDKFIVKDSLTESKVNWGDTNRPFTPDKFEALFNRVADHLKQKDLFVQQLFTGADTKYRLPLQVINEYA